MLETLWHFLDLYSAADLGGGFSPLHHCHRCKRDPNWRPQKIGETRATRAAVWRHRHLKGAQANTPARERRAASSMLYGYTAPGFHHTGPASLATFRVDRDQTTRRGHRPRARDRPLYPTRTSQVRHSFTRYICDELRPAQMVLWLFIGCLRRCDQRPAGRSDIQNPIAQRMPTAGSCMRGFRTPDGTRNPKPRRP